MPTTLEQVVIARLKGTAAVNDAVGGKIFATLDGQDAATPLVVVTKQGAEGAARLDGSRALKRYMVTVDVYATTEAAAEAIGKAVRDAITPAGTPWVDPTAGVKGAFFEDSTAGFTEDALRLQTESFGVWFQPTS